MSESMPDRPPGNSGPQIPSGDEALSRKQKEFAEALGHCLAEQWLQAHSRGESDVAVAPDITDRPIAKDRSLVKQLSRRRSGDA